MIIVGFNSKNREEENHCQCSAGTVTAKHFMKKIRAAHQSIVHQIPVIIEIPHLVRQWQIRNCGYDQKDQYTQPDLFLHSFVHFLFIRKSAISKSSSLSMSHASSASISNIKGLSPMR